MGYLTCVDACGRNNMNPCACSQNTQIKNLCMIWTKNHRDNPTYCITEHHNIKYLWPEQFKHRKWISNSILCSYFAILQQCLSLKCRLISLQWSYRQSLGFKGQIVEVIGIHKCATHSSPLGCVPHLHSSEQGLGKFLMNVSHEFSTQVSLCLACEVARSVLERVQMYVN